MSIETDALRGVTTPSTAIPITPADVTSVSFPYWPCMSITRPTTEYPSPSRLLVFLSNTKEELVKLKLWITL